MKPPCRKLCLIAGFEAVVIAGALFFWHAFPLGRVTVKSVSIEIDGFQRLPKEGNVTEFSSLADLDSELGSMNYRLLTPVDFSSQTLVRVGWVPEHTSGGKLEHTARFGGLMILFDVNAWLLDSDGVYRMAEDAWFVVPKSASVVTATSEDVRRKDWSAWLAITALAILVFVGLKRGSQDGRPSHHDELARVRLPAAIR